MSFIRKARPASFLLSVAAWAAWGPAVRGGELHVGSLVLQKTAAFSLCDGDREIPANRVLLPFEIRKIEGDRLYLSRVGAKGWAPAGSIVRREEAEAFFSKAVALAPGDPFPYLMRAVVRFMSGDENALADCNEAIRLDPKNSLAHLTRGVIQVNPDSLAPGVRKPPDEAIAGGLKDLEEARRLDPTNPIVLMSRAEAWGLIDQTDRALADFEAAIGLDPCLAEAHFGKALILVEQREFQKALAEYDAGFRIDPDQPTGYIDRANCWMLMNEIENALADLSEAIQRGSRDPEAYQERGHVWTLKEEYEKALKDLNEAILIEPRDPRAFYYRALVWQRKHEVDRALEDLSESIRQDPQAVPSLFERGQLYVLHRPDLDRAISDFSQIIKLEPTDAASHQWRGEAWQRKRAFRQALEDYDEAVRLDPDNAAASGSYTARAWIRATCPDAALRNGAQAVESATRACKLTGWNNADSITILAAGYAETGEFDAAVEWQERAIALFPSNDPRLEGTRKLLEEYKAREASSRPAPAVTRTLARSSAAPSGSRRAKLLGSSSPRRRSPRGRTRCKAHDSRQFVATGRDDSAFAALGGIFRNRPRRAARSMRRVSSSSQARALTIRAACALSAGFPPERFANRLRVAGPADQAGDRLQHRIGQPRVVIRALGLALRLHHVIGGSSAHLVVLRSASGIELALPLAALTAASDQPIPASASAQAPGAPPSNSGHARQVSLDQPDDPQKRRISCLDFRQIA